MSRGRRTTGLRSSTGAGHERIWDWEGDLIVGRMGQSAIGTLVERRSRLVWLVHLPDGHSAFRCRVAIEQVMASLPASARLTLTWA